MENTKLNTASSPPEVPDPRTITITLEVQDAVINANMIFGARPTKESIDDENL